MDPKMKMMNCKISHNQRLLTKKLKRRKKRKRLRKQKLQQHQKRYQWEVVKIKLVCTNLMLATRSKFRLLKRKLKLI
jgi:hypothetical protein